MLRRLILDPLVLLLLATVGLAVLLPAQGPFASAVDVVATAAIVALFFFHGAKLSREAVMAGLANWRLHLLILGTTFVLFPLQGVGMVSLSSGLFTAPISAGILYLAVLPSTVQSSIAFTSIARGNVPAAVAAASASQVLGVFLTPLLVGLVMGRQGGEMSLSSIGSVMLIVLLPFILGHLSRPLIGGWVGRHRSVISINDRAAILISVYGAFSQATVDGLWRQLPPVDLLVLAVLCTGLLAVVLLITFSVGRAAGLPLEDRITYLFCGSKKSLVQGIPMARVLFAGPDLGLILLPLMLFHQIQLMVCAWIAAHYAARGDDGAPDQLK